MRTVEKTRLKLLLSDLSREERNALLNVLGGVRHKTLLEWAKPETRVEESKMIIISNTLSDFFGRPLSVNYLFETLTV